MDRSLATESIKTEKLEGFNWFNNYGKISPNEVGIREKDNKWIVYTSDEIANPISEKTFDSESDALENFIKRLKAQKKFNDLYK